MGLMFWISFILVVTRDVIEIAGLSEELIEQWVELQLAKHAVNVDCKKCVDRKLYASRTSPNLFTLALKLRGRSPNRSGGFHDCTARRLPATKLRLHMVQGLLTTRRD